MSQQVVRRSVPTPGTGGGARAAHTVPGAPAHVLSLHRARALLALFGALALAVAVAPPAAAHDRLVGSDPADGSVLAAPPTQVVLTFSAAPLADLGGAAVEVTGPDGASWSDGEPVIAGTTVTQALRAGLPAGAYSVAWRSPSSDGHVLDGAFTFTVEAAATAPTPQASEPDAAGPDAEPTPTATAGGDDRTDATDEPGDEADPASADALPWLVAGLVVVAAAVVVTVVLRRRGGRA